MKQLYNKKNWLLMFSMVIVCNIIAAQNPYEVTNSNAPQSAKEEVSYAKKQKDPVKAPVTQNQQLPAQQKQAVKINGTKVSEEKAKQIRKNTQTSKKLAREKEYFEEDLDPQDTLGGKVKTFAKSKKSNLKASNIFEAKKDAFRLSKADKMLLKSSKSNNGRTLVTYQQQHNSIPVEGAYYKVRENDKNIKAFGFIAENINFSGAPSIDAQNGLARALTAVGAKKYIWENSKMSSMLNKIGNKPEGELVYVGPNFSTQLEKYHLAWKYDIYAIHPQSSQTVYVDANSGEVILKLDLQRDTEYYNGSGKGRYSGNVEFGTNHFENGFRLGTETHTFNTDVVTWNMNHEAFPIDEAITEFVDSDNVWYLNNEDNDEVAIDIQWGMEQSVNYYEEKFNRKSLDDEGMAVIGLAHLGENVANASWTGGWTQFGDGDNNNPFTPLAIVGHEITHAITQFSAGLIYEGESGAMNEAFSDIFGISIEFYVGKDAPKDIWELGDELYEYGALRSMSNPKAYGQPDTYGGENWANPADFFYDNGGVHVNSGVANYWYYLISAGGEGVNDLGNSYKVKPIGVQKAEKIAYKTLTEYLTPTSSFKDMRMATLMVVEDIYGIGSEEYIQVSNAWYAVGVGGPYSKRQINIVSYDGPSTNCGNLVGNEPIYLTIINNGEETLKAGDSVYYNAALYLPLPRATYELSNVYSSVLLEEDIQPNEQSVITIEEEFSYYQGYVNLISLTVSLNELNESNLNEGVNLSIEANLQEENPSPMDVEVVSVHLPNEKGSILPTDWALSATLKNLGCETIPVGTKMKVGYTHNMATDTIWQDLTLAKDWAETTEMEVVFNAKVDLSSEELHTLEVTVDYDLDPVIENNTLANGVISGIVSTFPYSEGFEKTPGGWTNNTLMGNDKWHWQKAPFIVFRDVVSEYAWGSSVVKSIHDEVRTNVAANADIALESPVFDFTDVALPYMKFDIHWWFSNGLEGLILEYSEDMGKTWKKIEDVNYPYVKTLNDILPAPWFTSINNQSSKDPFEAYIPELAGKKGMVRFRLKMDEYFDGFIGSFVDNIYVDDAPLFDVVLTEAYYDAGSCNIDNTNGKVKVGLINLSSAKNLDLDLTLDIIKDGDTISKVNRTAQFAVKNYRDTLYYHYDYPIDISQGGTYEFNVSAFPKNDTDIDSTDNSFNFKTKGWLSEEMKVSTFPYLMDFEDSRENIGWRTQQRRGSTGWLVGSENSLASPSWRVSEHTTFMASNDDLCNCDASEDLLISPVFDFSNGSTYNLSFDAFTDGLDYSHGYVRVSTDGGETWKVIYEMSNKSRSGWQEIDLDLSAYAGMPCVTIAFQHDDEGLFANGIAVDNILIRDYSVDIDTPNPSIAEVVYNKALGSLSFMNVKNIGFDPITKATLKYEIFQNGAPIGTPITEELNTNIIANDVKLFEINKIPELAPGTYEIKVEFMVEGDGDVENNKITKTFTVKDELLSFTEETFSSFEKGAIYGTNGWVTNKENFTHPWKIVDKPDNDAAVIAKIDHTQDDSKLMLYSQLENLDNYSELYSPVFNLEENKVLEFYYSMDSNVLSGLLVDIRPVGAKEWERVRYIEKRGDISDREWIKAVVNLSKYSGPVALRIRHAKASGYSYAVVDDIKIGEQDLTDLSVEFDSPKAICGTDENVVLKIVNEGNTPIAANSVSLKVDYLNTEESITEVLDVDVQPQEEYLYKLKQQIILNDQTAHVFHAEATLEGDMFEQNNSVREYVYQRVDNVNIFDEEIMHVTEGEPIYIDAKINILNNKLNVDKYSWNTDETTSGIYVTESGEYTVTVLLDNGCEITDTVSVVFDNMESTLQEGDVCSVNGEVTLDPGAFESYLWFDGSTNRTYTATESGDYYVTVYNQNGIGRTFYTSITINAIETPMIVQKGKTLVSSINAESYQWYLNGRAIPNANKERIVALWEGEYMLEVTNAIGCTANSDIYNTNGLPIGSILKPLRAYPNPTAGDLNLFMANKVEGETIIRIYSLGGDTVFENVYEQFPEYIDVHKLPKGLYLLECTANGEKYTLKIVKK